MRDDGTRCWKCEEDAKREKFLLEIDKWVSQRCLDRGLSPRETKARVENIPKGLKAALAGVDQKSFMEGWNPSKGWGIGGNTGCGKTMAMASMLRVHLTEWARSVATTNANMEYKEASHILWVSWPDEVTWLRSHALDPDAEFRLDRIKDCSILLLDDLGRERIRGSYADDWAASQLDGILNARYRNERTIIWTTNLTLQQLADIYGGAMLSRLTEDNPLIWVDGLKDLRG